MINFHNRTNIKEQNQNWPQIFDRQYTILITGSSGSGKTNVLLNPISHQAITDKFIYMLRIHMNQNTNC